MQAPEILGDRYELRSVIGRGGMAEVRDGWDARLQRAVAIKLMHPVLSADPQNRNRFDLEARAAARLNHPHVVAVHDSGDDDGTPFIVMERLPGPSLAEELTRGPLPPERVRKLLDQLLSALEAAHDGGILHRDIKPSNILFTATGDVKVVDFGIAKSPNVTMTEAGQVFGTMGYLRAARMAGHPATAADDLYAVAVVGYEALTGARPYPQQSMAELVRAVSEARFTPLTLLRPDMDPRLAATIDRALSPDPGCRFGTAGEMRAALWQPPAAPVRPATAVLSQPLPPLPAAIDPPESRRGGGRTLVAMMAAVALAVLAGVIILAIDSGVQRPLPAQPAETPVVAPAAPAPTVQMPPALEAPLTQAEQIKPPRGPGNNNGNGKGNGKGNGNGKGRDFSR